jgi:hypothetical protein
LKLLVKRFRKQWPEVRIALRAGSGFCRHRMLKWCDKHDVDYIVGIAKNDWLLEAAAALMHRANCRYIRTGRKQRLFTDIRCGALR